MDITSIEQLKNMLLSVGANEKDLDQIIKDVNEIILGKTLSLYESRLDDTQKDILKLITPNDIPKYIAEHKDTMPTLSKEELEGIAEEIWNDYFTTMKKS